MASELSSMKSWKKTYFLTFSSDSKELKQQASFLIATNIMVP